MSRTVVYLAVPLPCHLTIWLSCQNNSDRWWEDHRVVLVRDKLRHASVIKRKRLLRCLNRNFLVETWRSARLDYVASTQFIYPVFCTTSLFSPIQWLRFIYLSWPKRPAFLFPLFLQPPATWHWSSHGATYTASRTRHPVPLAGNQSGDTPPAPSMTCPQ